jgi:hypothetical protein
LLHFHGTHTLLEIETTFLSYFRFRNAFGGFRFFLISQFQGAHRHRFVAFVAGDFDEYLNRMRKPGTWGDQPELAALSEIYERPIWLYSVQECTSPTERQVV